MCWCHCGDYVQPEFQEITWCTFLPESKPEDREDGCLSSKTGRQGASSPFLSLLFYSGPSWTGPLTLGRAICFTVSANSNVNLFWKLPYRSPQSKIQLRIWGPYGPVTLNINSPSYICFPGLCPMSAEALRSRLRCNQFNWEVIQEAERGNRKWGRRVIFF